MKTSVLASRLLAYADRDKREVYDALLELADLQDVNLHHGAKINRSAVLRMIQLENPDHSAILSIDDEELLALLLESRQDLIKVALHNKKCPKDIRLAALKEAHIARDASAYYIALDLACLDLDDIMPAVLRYGVKNLNHAVVPLLQKALLDPRWSDKTLRSRHHSIVELVAPLVSKHGSPVSLGEYCDLLPDKLQRVALESAREHHVLLDEPTVVHYARFFPRKEWKNLVSSTAHVTPSGLDTLVRAFHSGWFQGGVITLLQWCTSGKVSLDPSVIKELEGMCLFDDHRFTLMCAVVSRGHESVERLEALKPVVRENIDAILRWHYSVSGARTMPLPVVLCGGPTLKKTFEVLKTASRGDLGMVLVNAANPRRDFPSVVSDEQLPELLTECIEHAPASTDLLHALIQRVEHERLQPGSKEAAWARRFIGFFPANAVVEMAETFAVIPELLLALLEETLVGRDWKLALDLLNKSTVSLDQTLVSIKALC